MATAFEPEVGGWYRSQDGSAFEVIALDERGGFVEVQYVDGTVEELDIDSWYEMELAQSERPEGDWSGPFDDLTRDDFGDNGEPMHPEEWSDPLDVMGWEE